jgi:hypothetical protein
MSPQMQSQNWNEIASFAGLVLAIGASVTYYVTFKTYHSSLTKMEQLQELM